MARLETLRTVIRAACTALVLPLAVGCGDGVTPPPPSPSPDVPAPPSGLQITALSPTSVRLIWQDQAGNEEGFRIYRGTSSTSVALIETEGTDVRTCEDTALAPSTMYFYRVTAFNGDGESSHVTGSITTPAVPFLGCPVVPYGIGNTITGTLSPSNCRRDGRAVHFHAFHMDRQNTVQVFLLSDDFDTMLHLFDRPTGEEVGNDDDGGPGTNSALMVSLAPGDYVLGVESSVERGRFRGGLGQYTLVSTAGFDVGPPLLLMPLEGSYVYQYASAPHCQQYPEGQQAGFRIDYAWTPVYGAVWYEIYAIHPGAIYPVLDNLMVVGTQFTDPSCWGYMASQNAIGWTWWVTAVLEDGTRLRSATGRYNFTDPIQP